MVFVIAAFSGFSVQVMLISSSMDSAAAAKKSVAGKHSAQKIVRKPVSFLVVVYDRAAKKEVWAQKSTVKDFLKKLRIPLNAYDRIYPGPKTTTYPGLFIKIVRVEVKQEKQKYAVPFTIVVKSNPRKLRSQKKILKIGVPGFGEKTLLSYYKDGKKTSTVEVLKKVVKAPVPQIVEEGSAFILASRFAPGFERATLPKPVLAKAGNKAGGSEEFMVMTATAYTPFYCGGSKSGKTATGIKAKKGVVAVDPRVIPLGTKLYIPGYGYAVAADTGGAIKGRRIDLCYNTRGEVSRFGKKKVKVYILK